MGFTETKVIPLLKEVEIFSEFNNDILQRFAENMKEVFLQKDETLFQKGDKENALYIILDGSVQIHDGDYVFTILNNKQFFGEYSLIDSSVRSATVTAVRDSLLLELKQETFDSVTNANPKLWHSVLVALIKRLRDYNILEEKLTMRTIDIQKKKYEIEQEKENIEQQKKELEAINQTKDKFFTIIAHDLKNPFSTVISLADSLVKEIDTHSKEQIVLYADQINRFSKNAFSLLENLLQWSRSQNGSLKINFKRSNLNNIIIEVIELFTGIAQQKSITIENNIQKETYCYVDVDMLTTVIRNLISNALKYLYQNGKIELNMLEEGDMLKIEVKDYGTGMDKDALEEIFRIDKTPEESTNEDDGSGLGLILCKEFVLKNGGEIWVNSNTDHGSSFTFTIPKAL